MNPTGVNITAKDSTLASPAGSVSERSTAKLLPAPAIASGDDNHAHQSKRWFLGPMPLNVVKKEVDKYRLDWLKRKTSRSQPSSLRPPATDEPESGSSSEETEGSIEHEHVYNYFIRHGGNEDEWDVDVERSLRKEIRKRWKTSGWYDAWKGRRSEATNDRKWVGSSFLIGDNTLQCGSQSSLLAVETYQERLAQQNSSRAPENDSHIKIVIDTPTEVLIAPAEKSSLPSPPGEKATSLPLQSAGEIYTTFTHRRAASDIIPTIESPTAMESLGTFNAVSDGHLPSPRSTSRVSSMRRTGDRKGRGKSVAWDSVTAPPAEVLGRSGLNVMGTSAGATDFQISTRRGSRASDFDEPIIQQDRMLVKVLHSDLENLPVPFTEDEASEENDLSEVTWEEFQVLWRSNHLELYNERSFTGSKWLFRKTHLAFVVPLNQNTRLSLFSITDSAFCIVCPASLARGSASKDPDEGSSRVLLHRKPKGRDVFIFSARTKSRAVDWTWHLWRHLRGELPKFIDVYCPEMGSRFRMPLSKDDPSAESSGFTRQQVLERFSASVAGLEDWQKILGSQINRGCHVELCWRIGANLDWIWLDTDVAGRPREWAVIFLAGCRQPKTLAHLEVRLARHAQTQVIFKDGKRISEPAAVEGYLYRIKPGSQTRSIIYLSSHDGSLFTMPLKKSFPPSPPVPLQANKRAESQQREWASQALRGAQQILSCEGYLDLRNIASIRRAKEPFRQKEEAQPEDRYCIESSEPEPKDLNTEEETADSIDHDDVGGDQVLAESKNKATLKLKRSLELVLRTGHVIRFEAYSCTIALAWICKLRNLVAYWTRRHRVDAREEMDLTYAVRGRPGQSHPSDVSAETLADDPYLGDFWNWCIIDGCRSVTKAGRLYEKKGPHHRYHHMYHVLVHGHLILFHLTSATAYHHRRSRVISLADAFLYSGQLAVSSLPRGFDGETKASEVPKRYQDGLEAQDRETDVTFIVRYHAHAPHLLSAEDPPTGKNKIPPLNAKYQLLICKARSKLERDSWCFAIQCEIERLARSTPDRERLIAEETTV